MATKDVGVNFLLDLDNTDFNTALGNSLKSLGSLAAGFAGIAGGVTILSDLGSAAITMGTNFDQSFAKVTTLFGDVKVDTDNLKDSIYELSNSTGIASEELTNGLYQALSAGIPVTEDMTEAMGFMEGAAKLSVAGFTDMESAVDVATTVLNAFGLESSETDRVMNTLIETQNAGKTTVDELASSLGAAIPSAASLGIKFEDLSAAVAVLTANGIGTAESMTMLKALFIEMIKPTSDLNGLYEEFAGKTIPEAIESGDNLAEVMKNLKNVLDDQGKTFYELSGSQEAWTAASTLTKDNGVLLAETFERMTDSTYELSEGYDKMQTPQQNLKKIQEEWNNILIDFWENISPGVNQALEYISDNMEWLGPLIAKAAVALGIFLVVGGALVILPPIIAAISGAFTALGGALTFLAGPTGIVIAGVVAAMLGLNHLIQKQADAAETSRKIQEQENEIALNNQEQFWQSNQEAQDIALKNRNKKYKDWSEQDQAVFEESSDAYINQIKKTNEEVEAEQARMRGEELAAEAKQNGDLDAIKVGAYADYLEKKVAHEEDAKEVEDYYNSLEIQSVKDMTDEQREIFEQYRADEANSLATFEEAKKTAQGVWNTEDLAADYDKYQKKLELLQAHNDQFTDITRKHNGYVLEDQEVLNGAILGSQLASYEDQTQAQYEFLQNLLLMYDQKFGEVPGTVAENLRKTSYADFEKKAADAGMTSSEMFMDKFIPLKDKIEGEIAKWSFTPISIFYDLLFGSAESPPEGGGGDSKSSKSSAPTPQSSSIPMFAKGGVVDGAGMAVVGEAGPEMILPLNSQGANFVSGLLKPMMSNIESVGSGISINIENLTAYNPMEAADELTNILDVKIGNKLLKKRGV